MHSRVSQLMQFLRHLPTQPLHRSQLEQQYGPDLIAELEEELVFTGQDETEPRTMSFSADRWWSLLQRKLDLPDERPWRDPVIEQTYYLGHQQARGLGRDVLVILGLPSKYLAFELAMLRERHPRALVLMPSAEGVSRDLILAHRPGTEFELAFLEHRLAFGAGRLSWIEAPSAGSVGIAPGARSETLCMAFDGRLGELTPDGYRAAVATATEQDLFLDLSAANGPFCRAGRRGPDGTFSFVELGSAEGSVLAQLMLCRPEPRRAASLRIGQGAHAKFVDRARSKLDVREGRYRWRFFQTTEGGADAKAYSFNPTGPVRFLLLCPPELVKRVGNRIKVAA